MKKFNEVVSKFIEENLKNPQKIVFMGSMGQGSYSGATAYEGAFFLESELESYIKKGVILPVTETEFYELDGLGSWVEGRPTKIAFDNLTSVFQWYLGNNVRLEFYEESITEHYKITMEDEALVLVPQSDEVGNETIYEVSPFLLSSRIWFDSKSHEGVFSELYKNFELETILVPKKEVSQ